MQVEAISQQYREAVMNSYAMTWVRRYFVAVGLVALCCAWWKYNLFVHTPKHVGAKSFETWVSLLDFGAYLLTVALLLYPWWRLGGIISTLGFVIALPSCIYILTGLSVADVAYVHEQTLFHFLLLSGLLAQVGWFFLSFLGENRLAEIADQWKQRLRRRDRERIDLVEEFILKIEGKEQDVTRWRRLAGTSDPTVLWKRLDAEWKRWLRESTECSTGAPPIFPMRPTGDKTRV